MSEDARWVRWRLVLGDESQGALGGCLGGGCLQGQALAMDGALGFLYGREYGSGRNLRSGSRQGGMGGSNLSVPDWINQIHELFPQNVIERLEKDAVERYKLEEMVTNPQVLQRVQPSVSLVQAVLRTKHLMNQEILGLARVLVRRVIDELMEKLARPMRQVFVGALDRRRRSPMKVAKNFDAPTTVRRNLANYDVDSQRLFIKTPYFFSRVRRHTEKWQVIILVDESGSMMGSVIHAAVTASIFFGLPTLRTHLVLFDTNVVDVTDQCTDPVETLMKVQLGGGTDIGQALQYASGLVDNPRRTIVVLITDFFEGAPLARLLAAARQLVESGVNLLGLAALDERDHPHYDRETAQRLADLGAEVGAMTPGQLACWVAEKVR